MLADRTRRSDPAAPPAPGPAHPVVFYDGGCPLCRREIDHYRRRDRMARLHWVDAAAAPGLLAGYGLSPGRALSELHVRDVTGRWHRGVDAFVLIWSRLPGYRWLAWLVALPGVHRLLSFVYRRFAAWRYRRRCGTGGCDLTEERT